MEWRQRKETSIPIEPHVSKKSIRFIASGLQTLDAEQKQITLMDGQTLGYDFLVLCTGPELAFDEIPGAGLERAAASVSVPSVMPSIAVTVWHALIEAPGAVIVGAMPGASCFGPAYEYACLYSGQTPARQKSQKIGADDLCHQRTLYIGHLGLNGVGILKACWKVSCASGIFSGSVMRKLSVSLTAKWKSMN